MGDYFDEMGWEPLGEGQTPNQLLHFARLLRDFGMWDDLGQTQRLPPPASREVVENLGQKTVTSKDDQCPVCLKMCSLDEIMRVLPCKHFFHSACILPWLRRTNSCPVCRHELPTDDEDYEMYRKEKLRAKQREEEIETLHNSMFS